MPKCHSSSVHKASTNLLVKRLSLTASSTVQFANAALLVQQFTLTAFSAFQFARGLSVYCSAVETPFYWRLASLEDIRIPASNDRRRA